MKRYASHFLFLPEYGYLRRQVVETEEGTIVRIFPLTEEVENTEWLPGVILLLPAADALLSAPFQISRFSIPCSHLPPLLD